MLHGRFIVISEHKKSTFTTLQTKMTVTFQQIKIFEFCTILQLSRNQQSSTKTALRCIFYLGNSKSLSSSRKKKKKKKMFVSTVTNKIQLKYVPQVFFKIVVESRAVIGLFIFFAQSDWSIHRVKKNTHM